MRSANFSRLLAYVSLLTLATSVVAKPLPKELPYNPQYKTLTARQAANGCHPNVDNLPENCPPSGSTNGSNAGSANGATDGSTLPAPSAQLIARPPGNTGASAGTTASGSTGSSTTTSGAQGNTSTGSQSLTDVSGLGGPAVPLVNHQLPAGTSVSNAHGLGATSHAVGTTGAQMDPSLVPSVGEDLSGGSSQHGANGSVTGSAGTSTGANGSSSATNPVAGTVNNVTGGSQPQVNVDGPIPGGPGAQVSLPTGAQGGSATVSNTAGGQGTVSPGDAIGPITKLATGLLASLPGSQSPNGNPASPISALAVSLGSPNLPSVNAQPQAGTSAGSSSDSGANVPVGVNVGGTSSGSPLTTGPSNTAIGLQPPQGSVVGSISGVRPGASPLNVNVPAAGITGSSATSGNVQPGANAGTGVTGGPINLSNINLSSLNLPSLSQIYLLGIIDAILATPGNSENPYFAAFLARLSTYFGFGQPLSPQYIQTLLRTSSLMNQSSLSGPSLITAVGTAAGTQSGANASSNGSSILSNPNLGTVNPSTMTLTTLQSIVRALPTSSGIPQSADLIAFLNNLTAFFGLGKPLTLQSLQTLLRTPSLVNQGNLSGNALVTAISNASTQSGANVSPVVNGSSNNLSNLNLSTVNLAGLQNAVQSLPAASGNSQRAFLDRLNAVLGLGQGQRLSLQSLQTLFNNPSFLSRSNLTGAALMTALRNAVGVGANGGSNISGGAQTNVSPSVQADVKSKLL